MSILSLMDRLRVIQSSGVAKEILISTDSVSSTWQPSLVVNSGGALTWSVSGGVVIGDIVGDAPILNLSGNTGTAVIKVSSDTDFVGLTTFNLVDNEVTEIDILAPTELVQMEVKGDYLLEELDVHTLTALENLTFRQQNLTAINTDSNVSLINLWGYSNFLTSVDLSLNTLLLLVYLYNNSLSTAMLDKIVTDLDSHGLSNGDLKIVGNTGNLSSASYDSYWALKAKGWSIDVDSPSNPVTPPVDGGDTAVSLLYNFHIKDGDAQQIYFDSSIPVDGLTTQGFVIEGITISGININGTKLTGHWLNVTTQNYWDNHLIKMDGGDATVPDFTLRSIRNEIVEAVSTSNKFVTDNASGGIGTQLSPWSLAESGLNALPGDSVNILAGDYTGQNLVVANNGTASDPIKFIGYNASETGYSRTRSIGMSFDQTIMPLLQNGSGNAILMEKDYVIFRNLQIDGYSGYGVSTNNADYTVFDNVYVSNVVVGIGTVNEPTQKNIRVINSYVGDCSSSGILLYNRNHLIDNTWSVSSKVVNMDYYITIVGGNEGYQNCIRDSYINRFVGESHSGHGLSLKADENFNGWFLRENLVENCDIVNGKLEARHRPCTNNIFRGCNLTDGANGMSINDGASYNTFENCKVTNGGYVIRWKESEEDDGQHANGQFNKIINCIGNGCTKLIETGEYFDPPESGTQESPISNNEILNCTFYNIPNLYQDPDINFDATNDIKNCVFHTCGSLGVGDLNATFSYSNFYNGFATPVGTGNRSDNPNFKDFVSFIPTNVLLKNGVTIVGIENDIDGVKRQTPVTMGAIDLTVNAKLHDFHIKDDDLTKVYFSSTRPIRSLSKTGFTIEGETVSSLEVNGSSLGAHSLTLNRALTYWDNILVRRESGDNTMHDFTLQYINNTVVEPTTTNTYYVATTGNDSNAGTDIDFPWLTLQKAATSAPEDSTVWIKKGTYTGTMTLAVDGSVAKPIKFIGYNDDPVEGNSPKLVFEDIYDGTISLGVTQDLPILDIIVKANLRKFIIFKNIQFNEDTNDQRKLDTTRADGIVVENCYFWRGSHGINATTNGLGSRVRVKGCYFENMTKNACQVGNANNLFIDSWAVTNQNIGMDYYFTFYGGDEGYSNCIKRCTVRRFAADTLHAGHGISLKADQDNDGYFLQYNLVEDCDVDNTLVEFRHEPTKYNVFRNLNMTSVGYINGTHKSLRPISFRDNCSYNRVENSSVDGGEFGIFYYRNALESTPGSVPGGSNNTVVNTIVKNCISAIGLSNLILGNQTNNKFFNCTFYNNDVFFTNGSAITVDSSNKFINCIMSEIPVENSGTIAPEYTYNNGWNYWLSNGTAISGTGNISKDPDFGLADVNFPTPANVLLKAGTPITGVEYDEDGVERDAIDPTIGAIEI